MQIASFVVAYRVTVLGMDGGWICEGCGSPADGDMCMKCGRPVAAKLSTLHDPGSHADTMGWPRSDLAARFHWGAVVLLAALWSIPIIIDPRTAPYAASLTAVVLFRMFVWSRLRAAFLTWIAKRRFRV